jgi:hypothetical protein
MGYFSTSASCVVTHDFHTGTGPKPGSIRPHTLIFQERSWIGRFLTDTVANTVEVVALTNPQCLFSSINSSAESRLGTL